MFSRKGRTESDTGVGSARPDRKARRVPNAALVFLSIVVVVVAIVEWQSPPPLPTVHYSADSSFGRSLPPISDDHWKRVAASVTGNGISVEPYNVHAPYLMRVVVKNTPSKILSTEEAEKLARRVREQLGVAAIIVVTNGNGVTLAKISPWWIVPARNWRL